MECAKCAQVSLWLADYISALDYSLGLTEKKGRFYVLLLPHEKTSNKYLADLISTQLHDMAISCNVDTSEAQNRVMTLRDNISAADWHRAKFETLPSVENALLKAIENAIKPE